MDKISLRKRMIKKRSLLLEQEVMHYSETICQRLESLKQYQKAKHIAFYYGVRGEVSLNHIWQRALTQGKTCYFPICDDYKMHFVPATPDTQFIRNHLGVFEPNVEKKLAIDKKLLDLVLTPLVAFDAFGMRLGMGKGYYDRAFYFLAQAQRAKPVLLGVAYDFQQQPKLDKQPWDILLDGIVTESKSYDCP